MRVLLLVALAATCECALLGRQTRQRQRDREAQGAQAACAAAAGGAAYWGGGQLYRSFTPPGMAYRMLRKPLLSSNQRVALALAAAAAGTSAARAAMAGDGPAADAMRQLGSAVGSVTESIEDVFRGIGDKARARREEREREARREYMRANAKPAQFVPRAQ